MKKFYIHSMGCKSNQFEGEIIKENLTKHGFVEVKKIEEAEIYILNSCSVTHKSDNEALYHLRHAKHKNPSIITVITGCTAQIEKDKLLANEFIDYVIGNDEKLKLFENLKNIKEKYIVSDIMSKSEFNKVTLNDLSKTRASLKIQDGCNNRCSYCIIPFARGKSRSADSDFIIEQINHYSEIGFKEVVLTGIHIGQWGKDINKKFEDLIKEIENKTTIKRYRLGSLNPLEITDELLEILVKSEKFCPHFHLSLQSACDKTLKSMNRLYKTKDYLEQIEKINKIFDLPFLGSDIITGFAGETEEDFNITLNNLKKSGLSQIHSFPYSIREGTIGSKSENQNPESVRQIRSDIIKALSLVKYKEFIEKNIGTTREILIEKIPDKKTGQLKGITRNYITVIINNNDKKLINTLQYAKIKEFSHGKIYGELI